MGQRPAGRRDWLSLGLLLALVLGLAWAARWWQGREDAQSLRQLARPGDILMIASDSCVFCKQATAWLQAQQVPFSECSIERDAQCLAQYRASGARGTPTFLVRGQLVLGFDRARIRQALGGG